MRIDSLIDGEAVLARDGLYGGTHPPSDEDWAPYAKYLDPCTGEQINTIGSYLIRDADKIVLHDAGMGPGPSLAPFACGGLRSALWALDVHPADVTDIIYSHLHIDHIGWTTLNGRAYFPNATLRIDRRDWETLFGRRLSVRGLGGRGHSARARSRGGAFCARVGSHRAVRR